MQASPTVTQPPGYQVEATKTYFTTSTYFTTLIDKGSTLTRTRTKVRSNVITETYAADNNAQFTGGFSTAATNQPIRPSQEPLQVYQYLSLGPQIYAKVKTLFSTILFTYTDISGRVGTSSEVITRTSISLFSTTKLPASITVEGPLNTQNFGTTVQLSPSKLSEIKQSYLNGQTEITNVQSTVIDDGFVVSSAKPSAGVIWDKPYLSSLKESFESSISAATTQTGEGSGSGVPSTEIPLTDINLPSNGPAILKPPGKNSCATTT